MKPVKANLTIVAGDSWSDTVRFVDSTGAPVEFAQHDATLQIRSQQGMYGPTDEETLMVEVTVPAEEWESPSEFNLHLDPDRTQSLNPTNARQVAHSWGLTLTDRADGSIHSIAAGAVRTYGRVVR